MWPCALHRILTLTLTQKHKRTHEQTKPIKKIINKQDYMSNGTRSNRVSESQLGRTEYGHDAVIFIYFISIGFIWLLYRTLIVIVFFCDLEFMHYFSCICNEFRFWRRTCSFTRHILTICLPFVFLSFHLFSFFYIFLPFLSLSLSLSNCSSIHFCRN